jgi:hypothetical protein
MLGFNGGRIGNKNEVTATVADGLWTPSDHIKQIRNEVWPGFISSIVTSGLVLNLDAGDINSYSGSGTTWVDLSGQGNTGTLVNGATYNSADGGYIQFDGTDDYVTTNNTLSDADSLFADSGNSWSTGCWFNTSGNGAINIRGGGFGSSTTYAVYRQSGILRVRLRGGTVNNIDSNFSNGVWNNIVVTWDGTTSKSYLNGSFVQNNVVGTVASQASQFTLGAAGNGSNNRLNGKISQMLVYNRALTASEITQNFDAIKGRYGL